MSQAPVIQSTVVHNTFVIERNYSKKPEQVFAALADAGKKRRWYAEGDGHDVELFESDCRVGGVERLRYRMKEGTPFPGVAIENEGAHQEVVKDRRIVIASRMSLGGKCISAVLVTFELQPDGDGTRLVLTHQGAFFEGADGPQMREMGWKALLAKLERALA
jgi:uncharacterized protein YndB with AHSA1/START domain